MLPNDVCRCAGLVGLSACKERDQCLRYVHRLSGDVFSTGLRQAGKHCDYLIPPAGKSGDKESGDAGGAKRAQTPRLRTLRSC